MKKFIEWIQGAGVVVIGSAATYIVCWMVFSDRIELAKGPYLWVCASERLDGTMAYVTRVSSVRPSAENVAYFSTNHPKIIVINVIPIRK